MKKVIARLCTLGIILQTLLIPLSPSTLMYSAASTTSPEQVPEKDNEAGAPSDKTVDVPNGGSTPSIETPQENSTSTDNPGVRNPSGENTGSTIPGLDDPKNPVMPGSSGVASPSGSSTELTKPEKPSTIDPSGLPAGLNIASKIAAIPELEQAINMTLPSNAQLGLPKDLDLQSFMDRDPEKLEKSLLDNPFLAGQVGIVNVYNIRSEKESTLSEVSLANPEVFDSMIAKAVLTSFQKELESILPEVSSILLAEIEKDSAEISALILEKGLPAPDIKSFSKKPDFSKLLSKEILDKVPNELLAAVRARLQLQVVKAMHEPMPQALDTMQKTVTASLEMLKLNLKNILEKSVKSSIPGISNKIQQIVDERVETKLKIALEQADRPFPESYQKLTEEELNQTLLSKISPKVGSYLRTLALARMQAAVIAIANKKIEKPLLEKFETELSALEEKQLKASLEALPSHLDATITKDYITQVAQSRTGWLNYHLLGGISAANQNLKNEMDAFIEQELTREYKIYLGNARIETDVPPINVNSRVLLPFRAIAEKLGAEVLWNDAKKQVTMKKDNKVIVLTIKSKTVYVNGEKTVIDVAPQISNSRTMVPIRFVSETFGKRVDWENDWRLVTLENQK